MQLSDIVSHSSQHQENQIQTLIQETLIAFTACRDLFSEIQHTDNLQDITRLAVIGEAFLNIHHDVMNTKIAELINQSETDPADFSEAMPIYRTS